jgi:hypothetical protein
MRIVFLLSYLPLSIVAQNSFRDSLRLHYDRSTIISLQEGIIQNAELKPQTISLKKDPLLSRLKTVPEAHQHYRQGLWNSIGAAGLMVPAFSALLIGVGTLDLSVTPAQKRFTGISLGIGIGASVLIVPMVQKSETHLHQAVWLYNRAAILRGMTDSLSRQKAADLYDTRTLCLTGKGFIQNGKTYKRVFFNQKLKPLFADNALAKGALRRSIATSRLSKPLFWLSTAAMLYGSSQLLTAESRTRNELRRGLLLGAGGFLVNTCIALPLNNRAQDNLAKAVWFYNREVFYPYPNFSGWKRNRIGESSPHFGKFSLEFTEGAFFSHNLKLLTHN